MLGYLAKYIDKSLFQLIYHPTFRCNSRCMTCFNWRNPGKKEEELTLEELGRISRNMPNFPWLLLSGGEPFLRQDIDSIVKIFASNNRVKQVTIPTNGLAPKLIRDKASLILKNNKNISLTMALSLDGLGAMHDKMRGVKGNFKKVLETFELCKPLREEYNNLSIKFHTVLTNYNYGQFDKIAEFVMKLRPDMHSFDFVRADTRDKAVKLPPLDMIEGLVEKIKKVHIHYGGFKNLNTHSRLLSGLSIRIMSRWLDLLIDTIKYNKQLIKCYAGKSTMVLYPYGDVAFCELLDPVGNLRDYDYNFKRLWSSKKANSIRSYIKDKKCYCYHPCYQDLNILFNPAYLFGKRK